SCRDDLILFVKIFFDIFVSIEYGRPIIYSIFKKTLNHGEGIDQYHIMAEFVLIHRSAPPAGDYATPML
ncbi:MAG: hypothetical protein QHG99_08625, partial [Methanomicrobiales archaeon]|nr:hypothetical protein [Methanomicrobiales archaeon]